MSKPPREPKIFHITHINNLASILTAGRIWSDAQRISQIPEHTNIGMAGIKARRLELPVTCHPGTTVGQYVPFYFCARSVMLYLLHRGNHTELNYQGGQTPILHLQADLRTVIDWANRQRRLWAFTASNAGACYTQYYSQWEQLNIIDWAAVAATNFSQTEVKAGKQAEFLLFDHFPVQLIERVGVANQQMLNQVRQRWLSVMNPPAVAVEPGWYF